MSKLILRKFGGGITEELTAVPGDVAAPDIFIGAGGDQEQTGTVVRRMSPTYKLPINGSLKLPAGHYDGGVVNQDIPTMQGQSIGPGAKQIVINTAGKYMTDNIIIRPVKNLAVDVIKKREFVGGVGPGTWEGYVNIDPSYLYYKGAQKEGYKLTKLVRWNTWTDRYTEGTVTLLKDRFTVNLPSPVKENNLYKYWYQNMIVFEGAIDFSKLSRIEIQGSISHIPSASRGVQIYGYAYAGLTTGSFIIYHDYFQDPNPQLGSSLAPQNPHADDATIGGDKYYDKVYPKTFLLFYQDYNQENTYYCDVSGLSGTGYLYIGFNNSLTPYNNANFEISTIKMKE